jgi:hypothetical protein
VFHRVLILTPHRFIITCQTDKIWIRVRKYFLLDLPRLLSTITHHRTLKLRGSSGPRRDYFQLIILNIPVGQPADAQIQSLTLRTGHLGTGREMGTGGGLRTAAHPLTAVVWGTVSHLQPHEVIIYEGEMMSGDLWARRRDARRREVDDCAAGGRVRARDFHLGLGRRHAFHREVYRREAERKRWTSGGVVLVHGSATKICHDRFRGGFELFSPGVERSGRFLTPFALHQGLRRIDGDLMVLNRHRFLLISLVLLLFHRPVPVDSLRRYSRRRQRLLHRDALTRIVPLERRSSTGVVWSMTRGIDHRRVVRSRHYLVRVGHHGSRNSTHRVRHVRVGSVRSVVHLFGHGRLMVG